MQPSQPSSSRSAASLSLPSALPPADPAVLEGISTFLNTVPSSILILALDYDGTISAINPIPSEAFTTVEMREVLHRLANCPRIRLVILSGRKQSTLLNPQFVGQLSAVTLATSHGFEIQGEAGSHIVGETFLPLLQVAKARLESSLSRFPGAALEDNIFSVTIHHRDVAEALRPQLEALVDEQVIFTPGLVKHLGKFVWELRPNMVWSKGEALEWVLEQQVCPFCTTFVGDDVTDEDGFQALNKAGDSWPIIVAGEEAQRKTLARFRIKSVEDMQHFLQDILALASEPKLA